MKLNLSLLFVAYPSMFLLLAVMVLPASLSVYSQPKRYGFRGGAYLVRNNTDMAILRGVPDCGTFSKGESYGYLGGFTVDVPLFGPYLELGGFLHYSSRPAYLKAVSNDNFQVLDPVSEQYVPLLREHIFDSDLRYLAFEISLRSRPISGIPVFVRLGSDIGNPATTNSYSQVERIVEPSSVLFANDRKERTTYSGELTDIGMSLGVMGALGVDIDLSNSVRVSPELGYRHGITSLSSTQTWNQSMFFAAVQISYTFIDYPVIVPPPSEPEPKIEPEPEPEPVIVQAPEVPPPPVIVTSISTDPLLVQETTVTQTLPVLPYIFFDSGSDRLPTRYIVNVSIENFQERDLPKNTMDIYYRILDIIGSRMQMYPGATLDVKGTTDAAEANTADARNRLALGRAKTVVTYLTQRWNIADERFRIASLARPTVETPLRYSESSEENRRVELTSATHALLAPVVHTKFYEYVPLQPNHEFSVSIQNPQLVKEWQLVVRLRDKEIVSKAGKGQVPDTVRFVLTPEITTRIEEVKGSSDTLDAILEVRQTDGDIVKGTCRFPLEKALSEFEVSRLSLIVFDYDKSQLADENKIAMKQVLNTVQGPGSTAAITGSTDRLGEMSHNIELSTQRAQNTAAYLRSVAPAIQIESVKGIGPSVLPYDNAFPEGRFYCRTVSILINTPVKRMK